MSTLWSVALARLDQPDRLVSHIGPRRNRFAALPDNSRCRARAASTRLRCRNLAKQSGFCAVHTPPSTKGGEQ